jgi:hypothetical protein
VLSQLSYSPGSRLIVVVVVNSAFAQGPLAMRFQAQ